MLAPERVRFENWNLLGTFERFERSRVPAWAWIILLWALFVFPAVSLRSFHFEEGYMIGVARSGMDDSVWLDPHLYGWRFNERPQLMGWMVGLLGLIFGGINQYVARAPTILSLLGSCLLVFWLVRRYAGPLAGLFAAVCFMTSPMILQKVVTAEPDFLLCFILFATFVVWWESFAAGKLGPLRWLAIGALLGLAGLVKGPQPLAFFGLGVGAFYLVRRRWTDLFGLACAGAIAALVVGAWYWRVYQPGDIEMWLSHSKINSRIDPSLPQYLADSALLLVTMLLEFLPGLILVVPFCFLVLRDSASKENDLVLALLLYATCCSLLLVLWPLANGRYAMPATTAIAALAGLAFQRFRTERPEFVQPALMLASVLCVYWLILCWIVMPAFPGRFQGSRDAALIVSANVHAKPATLYVAVEGLEKNVIAYLPQPVRVVTFDQLRDVPPPAWALLVPPMAERFREVRPDLDVALRASVSAGGVHQQLLELRAK